VCGALALGRLIASMLYGLKAWDPATLAGSATADCGGTGCELGPRAASGRSGPDARAKA
jgi:hypothetical protein